MIKETNNTNSYQPLNFATNWLDDLCTSIISIAESLKVTIFPPVDCSSHKFTQLPNDLKGLLFKNMGPSLLMFSSTCKTCQQLLNIPELKNHQINLKKYQQALELLRISYQKSEGTPHTLSEIIKALTLIFPDDALKIVDELCMSHIKCAALIAIAKSYIPFNTEKALSALTLAKNIVQRAEFNNKFDLLIPLAKISVKLSPQLTREILDFKSYESFDKFTLTRKIKIIPNISETLYSVEPKKACDLIKGALNELKSSIDKHVPPTIIDAIGFLLPVYALFDIETTLKELEFYFEYIHDEVQELDYIHKMKNKILISIIDKLAIHNPEKVFLIEESTFEKNPPEDKYLITYAKILKLQNQNEKAATIIEQAILKAQDYDKKMAIARALAPFDPEKAITVLNEMIPRVISDGGLYHIVYLESIFVILNDLNAEKTIIGHVENAFQKAHDLYSWDARGTFFNRSNIDNAITSFAVALAPFNLERALEMIEKLPPFEKASTQAKIAACIFQKTNEL